MTTGITIRVVFEGLPVNDLLPMVQLHPQEDNCIHFYAHDDEADTVLMGNYVL